MVESDSDESTLLWSRSRATDGVPWIISSREGIVAVKI